MEPFLAEPLIREAAKALLELVWGRMIPLRQADRAPLFGVGQRETRARDGNRVSFWLRRPLGRARGTLILAHGFSLNGRKRWYYDWGGALSRKHGLAVCGVDLRHHGRSGDASPTFGAAESWDITAVMDAAEVEGCPRPFVLFGESLGGMATQRTARDDERVGAAVCIHTPAYPWHAINVTLKAATDLIPAQLLTFLPAGVRSTIEDLTGGFRDLGTVAGHLINVAYGQDILTEGDIRGRMPGWSRRPMLLYVMGTEDVYDHVRTREVWAEWHGQREARINVWPDERSLRDQRKWFIEVPGVGHYPHHPRTVFQWKRFWPLVHRFLDLALGDP